jgi:3-hydroxybutyryl-CoA dehydrogenase
VEKIVVVGAGTMGAGIALAAAAAGFDVSLVEPDAAARDNAKARIAKDSKRAGAAGAAERIDLYETVQPDAMVIAAIEAVPERLELKRAVFAQLASALGDDVLLATNTSALSVSDIAESIGTPHRVVGLHFFNPATVMKLVEIVRTADTSERVIEQARSLVLRMNKTPVLAADTPGFIVNRVARPYYLQAMRAYEEGVAPIEDLDRLARGVGFRMGPFELMDMIGIDVNLATSESIYERTNERRLEPVDLQRQMVAQNRLGRKTGAGFYDYSNGTSARNDAVPEPAAGMNVDENIVILGYAGLALELEEMLSARYQNVQLWEDEESLDAIPLDTTMVFDIGDGKSDRTAIIASLDSLLPAETMIFVDAYASDAGAMAKRTRHPERVIGYGILASLAHQRVVEIVDAESTSDDALELAQDVFESIGRSVVLVENSAGLFLGRTIGSVVNEAVTVVDSHIASAEDVDLAMRLGTNYPQGPLEWGREIGGDRIVRILQRVAGAEGAAFAPHRALWVLDVQEEDGVEGGDAAGNTMLDPWGA